MNKRIVAAAVALCLWASMSSCATPETHTYRLGDGQRVITDAHPGDHIRFEQVTEARLTRIDRDGDALFLIDAGANSGALRIGGGAGMPLHVQRETRPNIVVIMADDLGWGHLGVNGSPFIQTPHLDALAANGALLTDFYSGAPHCPPARSSLMEGKHTGHTTVRRNSPIPDDTVTLPRLMRDAGYATAMFGKWGMAAHVFGDVTEGDPHTLGFDRFVGFLTHRDAHVYYLDSPNTCAESTPQSPWYAPDDVARTLFELVDGAVVPRPLDPTTYVHDVFIDEAVAFLGDGDGAPKLLYMPLTIPHAEIVLPPGEPTPQNPYFVDGESIFPCEVPYLPAACDAGQPDRYRRENPYPYATMATMITRLDSDVQRIVDALVANGLDDNTILFFTSDNGPHDAGGILDAACLDGAGPFRGMKWDLYEGGVRVPMIAWGPGLIPPGREIDEPYALWDILVTALDYADVPRPADADGVSMRGALAGGTPETHAYLYWETYNGASDHLQAVRMGQWKLLKRRCTAHCAGPCGGGVPPCASELYNLIADPGETTNLVNDPLLCDVVQAMLAAMNASHEPPRIPQAWIPRTDGSDVGPTGCDIDCPGDIDGNDAVGFDDLSIMLEFWGEPHAASDVNGSGLVDFADLNLLLTSWGVTCLE